MSDGDYESIESPDSDVESPDNSYEMQYPARRGNSHERKNPYQAARTLLCDSDVFAIAFQSERFADIH